MIRDEIINRAIDYIIEHIEEEISIEAVAGHCGYSKYHFSRKFKEEMGENLYAFVKRLKMNQSAIRLQLEKGRSVTDIGLDYGYDASNFSAVFKKQHKQPPARYRKDADGAYFPSPYYQDGQSVFPSYEEYNQGIAILERDACNAVYERCVGNYIEIKDKWQVFIEKYGNFIQEDSCLLERYYDDPSVTELEKCVYDLCATVAPSCSVENTTIIPGGLYAVYRYAGRVEGIYNTVQGLFRNWLPDSGYTMAARHSLNIYHAMNRQEMYVEMDICIPVKSAIIHK